MPLTFFSLYRVFSHAPSLVCIFRRHTTVVSMHSFHFPSLAQVWMGPSILSSGTYSSCFPGKIHNIVHSSDSYCISPALIISPAILHTPSWHFPHSAWCYLYAWHCIRPPACEISLLSSSTTSSSYISTCRNWAWKQRLYRQYWFTGH